MESRQRPQRLKAETGRVRPGDAILFPAEALQVIERTGPVSPPPKRTNLGRKGFVQGDRGRPAPLRAEAALKPLEGKDGNLVPVPIAADLIHIDAFSRRSISKRSLWQDPPKVITSYLFTIPIRPTSGPLTSSGSSSVLSLKTLTCSNYLAAKASSIPLPDEWSCNSNVLRHSVKFHPHERRPDAIGDRPGSGLGAAWS